MSEAQPQPHGALRTADRRRRLIELLGRRFNVAGHRRRFDNALPTEALDHVSNRSVTARHDSRSGSVQELLRFGSAVPSQNGGHMTVGDQLRRLNSGPRSLLDVRVFHGLKTVVVRVDEQKPRASTESWIQPALQGRTGRGNTDLHLFSPFDLLYGVLILKVADPPQDLQADPRYSVSKACAMRAAQGQNTESRARRLLVSSRA
jgi:hypothetical protein